MPEGSTFSKLIGAFLLVFAVFIAVAIFATYHSSSGILVGVAVGAFLAFLGGGLYIGGRMTNRNVQTFERKRENLETSWQKVKEENSVSCPHCGTRLDSDSHFCWKCGYTLDTQSS